MLLVTVLTKATGCHFVKISSLNFKTRLKFPLRWAYENGNFKKRYSYSLDCFSTKCVSPVKVTHWHFEISNIYF